MNSVDALRVEKDSLGKCCLARIDMGTDAYIPYFLQIFVHLLFLCYSCLAADYIRLPLIPSEFG